MNWKPDIIEMTQFPEARVGKIDSTFFPPLSSEFIYDWEKNNNIELPGDLKSYYLKSDGLEACKGELIPILPLKECSILPAGCSLEKPWIEFGRSREYRYYFNTATMSIFRSPLLGGSDPEFFARSLTEYLEKVFRGKS